MFNGDVEIMNPLYQYIFKRKSFHLFRDNKSKEYYKDKYHITNDELVLNATYVLK